MNKIRIIYTKTEKLKYISHLDVIRMFMRVLRRANLPVELTQGFSPKYKMAFSKALSLGVESLFEAVDVNLLENEYTILEIEERLKRVLPCGMDIVDVVELTGKESKLSGLTENDVYEIKLNITEIEFNKRLEKLNAGEFVVEKKEKQINLKDKLISSKIKKKDNNSIVVKVILNNMNPFLFIKGFMQYKDKLELSVPVLKVKAVK
jgi:radical SAM-linked protein